MAGDWMQIDLDLPDKAEVRLIKANTGLGVEAVVGRLISLWRWVERDAVDGVIKHANAAVVADIVNAGQEFVDTLCAVGWLKITDSGVEIPGWDKRFSKAAKQRSVDAKRKATVRKSSEGCPKVVRNVPDKTRTEPGQNSDTPRTKLGAKEELEKEYNPPPPTPSGAEAVSGWQEEEGAIGVALRRRGVSAAAQCIAAAKSAGHPPEHIRAIIAEFDAQKGAWGAGALYKRIVGELADWPEPSREFLAAQARDTASRRANELHDVHEAQRREAAESAQRKAELEKLFGPKVDSLTVEQQRQLLREHCDEAEAKSLLPFVKKNRVGSLARERLLEIAAMLEQEAVA